MSQKQKKSGQCSILNFIKILPKEQYIHSTSQTPTVKKENESQHANMQSGTNGSRGTAGADVKQEHKQNSVQQIVREQSSPLYVIRPQTSPQVASPEINLSQYTQTSDEQNTRKQTYDTMNVSQLSQNDKSRLTPAGRQYYAIKELLDENTVLYVQNGHFYELYDSDGVFGVEYLNLKGVRKPTGQFIAGVPICEKTRFYFQKTLLLNRRVAVVDQVDDVDRTFKVQMRQITAIYSVSCQDFFETNDERGGLLYIDHIRPGEPLAMVFYDYRTNEAFLRILDYDKQLYNNIYALIVQMQPLEVLINDNITIKNQLDIIFGDSGVFVQNVAAGHFVKYLRDSNLKAYKAKRQIDEIQRFGLLNDYLTYLNVYPCQERAASRHVAPPPHFNLPFTTIQTLQLLDVEAVLRQHLQTRSGRVYFHAAMVRLGTDEALIRQKQRVSMELDKSRIIYNFKGLLDISQFRLSKPDQKNAFRVFQSLKVLRLYLGRVYESFPQLMDSSFERLEAILAAIDNCFVLNTQERQITLSQRYQYELNDLETQLNRAQLKFLNDLNIEHVSNPIFTNGYGAGAAKTALGFTTSGVLVVGKLLINSQSQFNKLKQTLQTRPAPNCCQFIETAQNCHKFTMPEFLFDMVKHIDDFKAKNIEENVRSIFAQIEADRWALQQLYGTIGMIDCMQAMIQLKNQYSGVDWCIPQIVDYNGANVFQMESAYHPLCFNKPNFTPLSFSLQTQANLLTGPNMSGKSTFLRILCITAILAQIGCFVPCKSMKMTMFMQILARVGGYDFGNSTFQTEMVDCAKIMELSTERSLVAFDEIGRGTENLSSDAIGQGILKYLIRKSCFSIVSTHSQQIRLCAHICGCSVYQMRWEIVNEKTVKFYYQVDSVTDENDLVRSMGCEVAEMAGVSRDVIFEAKKLRVLMENAIQADCRHCIEKIINE